MTEPRLSPETRSLLQAAKADGPGAAARAKVWSAVSSAAGGVATGAGVAAASTPSIAPGVAAGSGVAASKMLVIGTLLGGTVTIGLAAMFLRVTGVPVAQPPSAPMAAHVAAPPAQPVVEPASFVAPSASVAPRDPLATTLARAAEPSSTPVGPGSNPVPAVLVAAGTHPAPAPADDTLAREASLLAQAHAALVHGDPRGALRAARAAEALPSHALGPEELSVEAQALRALGHDGQANDVDSTLKKQFPDSALAR